MREFLMAHDGVRHGDVNYTVLYCANGTVQDWQMTVLETIIITPVSHVLSSAPFS